MAWKLVDIVNLMKVCEVSLTLAKHDSDIKIKACTQRFPQSFVTRFCA